MPDVLPGGNDDLDGAERTVGSTAAAVHNEDPAPKADAEGTAGVSEGVAEVVAEGGRPGLEETRSRRTGRRPRRSLGTRLHALRSEEGDQRAALPLPSLPTRRSRRAAPRSLPAPRGGGS